MNPKPILTIKTKCTECSSYSYRHDIPNPLCKSCKGSSQQTTEIYKLKDFKCPYCINGQIENTGFPEFEDYLKKTPHELCKGTGYKIDFKDYEIKKVSELTENYVTRNKDHSFNGNLGFYLIFRFGLKEDDKLVVKRCSNQCSKGSI